MVLLYGHVLLSHPRFQVYLSIFLGLSFTVFQRLSFFFSCSFYSYVVSASPVLQFWQTIISIIEVNLVVIYFIILDFKREYFFLYIRNFCFKVILSKFYAFYYSGTSLKRTFSKADICLRQTKNFVPVDLLRNPL